VTLETGQVKTLEGQRFDDRKDYWMVCGIKLQAEQTESGEMTLI
jgi:hypothetical protein